MNELYAYWESLPPWLKTLIPALFGLIPYGYHWLRHRHLDSELKKQDVLKDKLQACQRYATDQTKSHTALLAQVNAELLSLIQQAQTCPPEQQPEQHEKLAQWLANWQQTLGEHATHLALAQQANPDNTPQQWLRLALLAAALGNQQAAALLIEDELEMLAKDERLAHNELAWERLFATIRPKRQEELSLQFLHANEKGVHALEQADYAMAGKWLRFGLYLAEIVYGTEHPNVATSLNQLSGLYHAQGKNAQAKLLLERALKIWEQASDEYNSDLASGLINLAEVYRTQGNNRRAEALFTHALNLLEKVDSEKASILAHGLNGLAVIYQTQGSYTQAKLLNERALNIWERSLGNNHPDVALSLNNLAELYRHQGNYALAEPLHLRSLAILEQALGAHHPDVATSLENLAVLYRETDREQEAATLEQRAAAIRAIQR